MLALGQWINEDAYQNGGADSASRNQRIRASIKMSESCRFFTDLAYLPSAVNGEEVTAFPVPHCGILSLRGHSSCCKYPHSYAPSLYVHA